MSRYFTKPRAHKALWVEDEVFTAPSSHMVTVCDHEATDTGLIDASGDTIWRAPNPVGFIWNEGK